MNVCSCINVSGAASSFLGIPQGGFWGLFPICGPDATPTVLETGDGTLGEIVVSWPSGPNLQVDLISAANRAV